VKCRFEGMLLSPWSVLLWVVRLYDSTLWALLCLALSPNIPHMLQSIAVRGEEVVDKLLGVAPETGAERAGHGTAEARVQVLQDMVSLILILGGEHRGGAARRVVAWETLRVSLDCDSCFRNTGILLLL